MAKERKALAIIAGIIFAVLAVLAAYNFIVYAGYAIEYGGHYFEYYAFLAI